MRIPGIYIDIKGDLTQLDADMRKARAIVREAGTGMSNALNNALSPGQIQGNVNSLVRQLGTLKRTGELVGDEFDKISVDLGEFNDLVGLSEKEFSKLQQRMLRTKASAQADRAIQSIARSTNMTTREMGMLRLKMGDTTGAMREFGRVGVAKLDDVKARAFSLHTALAGLGVLYAAKDVNAAGKEARQLTKSYDEITKSSEATRAEFEYLRTTSRLLGQNFWVLNRSYLNYLAAAKMAKMETEQTRVIFTGLNTAFSSLSTPAEKVERSINAVTQMISKGKVQAEELRGQLGEHLPGAFGLAAEAMGVSTSELNVMLERGEVFASELLPKLGKLLSEKFTGEVDKATRAANKYDEALQDLKVTAAESGFTEAWADMLTGFADIMRDEQTLKAVEELADLGGDLAKTLPGVASSFTNIFSTVIEGWEELPEVIQDIGLVGALIGGAKARAALLLITAAIGQAKKFDAAIKGVSTTTKYSAMLEQENIQLRRLQDQRDSLRGIDVDTFGPKYDRRIEAVQMRILNLQQKIQDGYKKEFAEAEKAAELSEKATSSRAGDKGTNTNIPTLQPGKKDEKDKNLWLSEKDLARRRISETNALYQEWQQGWAKRSGRDMESETRQFEQAAAERKEILGRFTEDYAQTVGDMFEFERSEVEATVDVYRKAGADEKQLAALKNAKLKALDEKYTAIFKKEQREKLEASNDFFKGLKAGFQDIYEANETWAERGIDIARDFSTSSKSALSDIGVDAMRGQLDDFSSYYETFLTGLRRSLADHMADLVVNKGMGVLVEYAGGMFDAGSSATQFLSNIFHTGNIRLNADEVAAILQQNEMVIPARQAEVIRQSVGSSGMSKAQFFDRVVDYVNVGSQSTFDAVNNSQRDVYGNLAIGSALNAAKTGAINAASNWFAVDSAVSNMKAAGLSVDMGEAGRMQWNSALGGMVGSFFPSFAGNVFGSFGNQLLGMNDEKYDLAGIEFSSSSIGDVLSMAAATFFGGPIGTVLAGTLSPAFSLAVSGVADLFDLRDNELLRDALEDSLGFIGGRVAFSAYKDRIATVMGVPGAYSWGYEPGYHAGLSHQVMDGYSWLSNENLEKKQIIELIKNDIAKGKSESAKGAQSRVNHLYTAFGDTYAQQAWDDPLEGVLTANAVWDNWGFASYDNRKKAAETLKKGREWGDSYYTPDGRRVDINSVENPNSELSKAYSAATAAADSLMGIMNSYQLGDFGELGDRGGNALGGYRNYTGVPDYGLQGYLDFGNRMEEFADTLGSDSDRDSDRTSGFNGSGDRAGGKGSTGIGRRYGGPVQAGQQYIWQEKGLPGEIFMPQTDGFVLNHEISQQFIAAVRSLVDSQGGGVSVPSGEGGNLVVKLVVGEDEIASAVIPGLLEASKNGVQFVHADTLIEER